MKTFFCILLVLFTYSKILAEEKPKIKSLGVKEAIDIALDKNPELLRANYLKKAAESKFWKDISLPPMNISLSNEYIPTGKGFSNFDERTFEISQDFDFPLSYFSKGKKSTIEIETAGSEIQNISNWVRTSVKRNYFICFAKNKILKTYEENLVIANEFYKKADIKYKIGEGTNLELLTSKIQLTEAKSYIEVARKEYRTALAELKYSMGNNEDIDFENLIFSDSLLHNQINISLYDLIKIGIETNPSLRKSKLNIESLELSKKIAWENILPSFNAAYMFQTRANDQKYYGVRFGMSLPLWFMFDQRGQIQESNANFLVSNYEYELVKNNLIKKINQAYIDFLNDESQLTMYEKELNPQAEEIYRTAELSYQAGEITYLEYLQAKFTTINTKINFIKSLFDYKEAIINLEEATGTEIENN